MIILGTNSIKDTGFNVANSLRFENSNSEQLTRSIGSSPTNTKKGTFSYWIKRTKLSTNDVIVSNEVGSSSERAYISFNTSDYWRTVDENGIVLATNAVFRDVSAWTNFVLTLDSTLGTETDRVKLYINGTRYTDFQSSSYFNNGFPNQDIDFDLFTGGQTNKHHIGNIHGGSSYLDGYLAEVCYCDGQTLDASSFGEFSEDSPNIWMPKNVSGLTFGNNGYYLDFEDSSALGNDAAGSNNFTVSNITAIDQSLDTCTNNFATMNPLDNYYAGSTFSEGNCRVVTGSSPVTWNTSTFGLSAGKWYMEATIIDGGSGGSTLIGIADRPTISADEELGGLATTYAYLSSGNFRTNNTNTSNSVSATDGDIIGVALDLDSSQNTISYYKNNVLIVAAQDITAPVSGFYFIASGVWLDSDTGTTDHNFGNPVVAHSSAQSDANGYGSFEYAPPTGYLAICTKNLGSDGG
jgi:hypothetical protein